MTGRPASAARSGSPTRRLRAVVGQARARRPWTTEVALVVMGGLAYFLVRGGVVDRAAEADARAHDLIALQRSLGLDWEQAMQGWVLSHRFLVDLANGVYFWGHMPVIAATAVWLFWRRRSVYRRARNAFLVSAMIALPLYYTLPVTPPRLLPDQGIVDTLALYHQASYQAQEAGAFVNPYAALPSLHIGWALLIAWACWLARPARCRWAVVLVGIGLVQVGAQFCAVVMTGNHYVLDAVAGAAAVAVGALAATWWDRREAALQGALQGAADLRG